MNSKKRFCAFSMFKSNPNYQNAIKRDSELYERKNDIRSDFFRDYTRIIHSTSYRRLKHKTQVFFATHNDHVCTRIEHVNHVASISYTISKALGLNYELCNAIATGHDIGHPPFGHQGEYIINKIAKENELDNFWHERNSLFFIDNIETLPDENNNEYNLNLTYAVRDGIICHCGEIDQDKLLPRKEYIKLETITTPGQVSPYTWEGCIVKIADKISYLGRDIEDALILRLLDFSEIKSLKIILEETIGQKISIKELNNPNLIHGLLTDLLKNSNPKSGLQFSKPYYELLKQVKDFNYRYIYNNPALNSFKKFVELVIYTIYETMNSRFSTLNETKPYFKKTRSPLLNESFSDWLDKYSFQHNKRYRNKKVFNILFEKEFKQSIIYFISGMTDNFAISIFNELNEF